MLSILFNIKSVEAPDTKQCNLVQLVFITRQKEKGLLRCETAWVVVGGRGGGRSDSKQPKERPFQFENGYLFWHENDIVHWENLI